MQQEKIINILKDSGLRITKIRKAIANLFCISLSPLSASEITRRISANKTTIYRDLEKLVSLGVLQEVDLSDGNKRYELADKGHHHHLVCINCKTIIEFDLKDDFSIQERLIMQKKNFKVLKHNLEFFGICSNCN